MFSKHEQAKKDAPKWMKDNIHYEVIMGSYAYGVHNKDSDKDIYGFAIPPKNIVFPFSEGGNIYGFGKGPEGFDQFQKCYDDVDFSIYGIVKYFDLCLHNNPNMIDSLFVPDNCVCHMSSIGELVRKNRHKFLCSKLKHTYAGYAHSQLHKLKNKDPNSGKRKDLIEKYGYDTKFAYHIVRLVDYAEQLLQFGDMDLQRDKECWKAIRAGEWSLQKIQDHFDKKDSHLEDLYKKTILPHKIQETAIKELLLNCLEHHFGSLDNVIKKDIKIESILKDMQDVIDNYA